MHRLNHSQGKAKSNAAKPRQPARVAVTLDDLSSMFFLAVYWHSRQEARRRETRVRHQSREHDVQNVAVSL